MTPAERQPVPVAAPPFRVRFLRVWILGMLGVGALAFQELPATLLRQVPELASMSPLQARLAILANPLLLATVGALLGAVFAHRARLGSRLAGTWPPHAAGVSRPWLATSVLAGLAVAAVLAGGDLLFAPWIGAELARLGASAPGAGDVLVAMLYGGVAEEVMLRWGVMSLVLFALLRLGGVARRVPAAAPPPIAWVSLAILVAALLFAAGHLPALALALGAEPSPALVARTLLLNAIAGVVYGALFHLRGLESAMLAHAATHVGLALARLA